MGTEERNVFTRKIFRKKYPGLFPKVSLDRLESIEENVYSKCTYCKYDPKSGAGGGGAYLHAATASGESATSLFFEHVKGWCFVQI